MDTLVSAKTVDRSKSMKTQHQNSAHVWVLREEDRVRGGVQRFYLLSWCENMGVCFTIILCVL